MEQNTAQVIWLELLENLSKDQNTFCTAQERDSYLPADFLVNIVFKSIWALKVIEVSQREIFLEAWAKESWRC